MQQITSRARTLPPTQRPRVAYYDLGSPFRGAVWSGMSITWDPATGHSLVWGAEFSQDGANYFCSDLETGRLEVFPMHCREHGPVFQTTDGTIYAPVMSGLSADHGHRLCVFDALARAFTSLGLPLPGDQRLLCIEECEGQLYLGGHELAELYSFDPRQRLFTRLCRPFAPPTDRLVAVHLLPDGRLLMVGYPNGPLKIYNVNSGEVQEAPDIPGLATPVVEGARLFLTDGDGVRVLDADFNEVSKLRLEGGLRVMAMGANSRGSGRGVVYGRCRDALVAVDAESLEIRHVAEGVPPGVAGMSRDGRLVFADVKAGQAVVIDASNGVSEKHNFEVYLPHLGSAVCALGCGPDDRIYGTNIYGMHLCAIDQDSDAIDDLGYTWSGGELYHAHTHGDKLYVGSYGGSNIGVYDPKRPWRPGAEADCNPRNWGPLGSDQNRPFEACSGPDGRIYVANRSNYGVMGGALVSYDPETALDDLKVHMDIEQSIQCVAADDRYIYGGTSIYGGRGAPITTREGLFFVFDPETGRRIHAVRPVVGATTVTSLAVHPSGRVFGTTDNRCVFVFDPELLAVEELLDPLRSEGSRLMGVPEGVEMFPVICAVDGFIYGVTRYDLFRIDGVSRVITYLNDPPLPELYAIVEGRPGRLYISAGTRVIRVMLTPPPYYR